MIHGNQRGRPPIALQGGAEIYDIKACCYAEIAPYEIDYFGFTIIQP